MTGADFLNCTGYEAALAAILAAAGDDRRIISATICQNIGIMNPSYEPKPLPHSVPRLLASIYILFVYLSQPIGIGALHGFAAAFPLLGVPMADVPLATRLTQTSATGFSQVAVVGSFFSIWWVCWMLGSPLDDCPFYRWEACTDRARLRIGDDRPIARPDHRVSTSAGGPPTC